MNLKRGWPNETLLPIEIINKSMKIGCVKSNLNYGGTKGELFFRKSLTTFLNSKNDNNNILEDDLLITNGISHSLLLLILIIKNINHKIDIFVENPTYFLAINIFKNHNINIIPIDEYADINNFEFKNDTLYLYYIIPFFQNPTGKTINYDEINILLNILQNNKKNLYIISDEAYQLFDNKNVSLAHYNNNIISLGSFSKILCPGIRLGWIFTKNHNIIEQYKNIAYLKSGGGVSPITQKIVYNIIESGELCPLISSINNYIHKSINIIDNILLPLKENKTIFYIKPKGGYFFWIKLLNVNINEFFSKMEQNNVIVLKGNNCSYNNSCNNFIRICNCYLSHKNLKKAIENMRNILL